MPKQARLPLSETVCRRRLTKFISKHYSEEMQEYIGYYNDIILDDTYSFLYELPTGENKLLTLNRMTESISETEVVANEIARLEQIG